MSPVWCTHLRPLGLDTAEAVGPVDDGVFGDHLVGVDVTAGPDDAAARQDDVPADKRCQGEESPSERPPRLNPAPLNTSAAAGPAPGAPAQLPPRQRHAWVLCEKHSLSSSCGLASAAARRIPCRSQHLQEQNLPRARTVSQDLPLDSMTLLSPTFIAWESTRPC